MINHADWAEHAKHLSTQAKADMLQFLHDEVGYNYRMTNVQACLGLAQLERLEGFVETKKARYDQYKAALDVFCRSKRNLTACAPTTGSTACT